MAWEAAFVVAPFVLLAASLLPSRRHRGKHASQWAVVRGNARRFWDERVVRFSQTNCPPSFRPELLRRLRDRELLPWIYFVSPAIYSLLGLYIWARLPQLTRAPPPTWALTLPFAWEGGLLLAAGGVSFAADSFYLGCSSPWHGMDRLFAMLLVLLHASRLAKLAVGCVWTGDVQISTAMRVYALLPLAMLAKWRGVAARRGADLGTFLVCHSLWRVIPCVIGVLIVRLTIDLNYM